MARNQMLDLPQELLGNILSFLPPCDIVRFGSTSKTAQRFISPSNQILWHSAFLHLFDEPEHAWSMLPDSYVPPRANWDWHSELRRRLLALAAIKRGWSLNDDAENSESHITALLSIVDTAKFCPTPAEVAQGKALQLDDRSSLNLERLANTHEYSLGLDKLIHDTRVLKTASRPEIGQLPGRAVTRSMAAAADEANRSESASRLHVLCGITTRERKDHRSRGPARRKVYNWSLTNVKTDYGPFDLNGSGKVNWSLLEGVCSVMCRNFEMCVHGHITMPQGLCYSIPHRTLVDPTIPEDWARATGPWLGTYSFLDYNDLFAFNSGTDSRTLMLDEEPEACGDLMKLEIKLDFSVKDDPKLKTMLPICYDRPPLYFVGSSSGQDYNHRPLVEVKGLVTLLPGGREVRWKFIIAYNGSDQWQLEGVQPGGIRSGGVYGLWSQVDHEENAPIGPFCYFPMELCKRTSVVLVS